MSESYLAAMKTAGRWPGRWVTDPNDWKLQPDADRAPEALRRGALNPDGSPCTTFWCAGGFDHPLGTPFYEVRGDPRHNGYCIKCTQEAFEGEAGVPPTEPTPPRTPWEFWG